MRCPVENFNKLVKHFKIKLFEAIKTQKLVEFPYRLLFFCLPLSYFWISEICLFVSTSETYSESCRTSKMEFFAEIVSGFHPLTIFAKSSKSETLWVFFGNVTHPYLPLVINVYTKNSMHKNLYLKL